MSPFPHSLTGSIGDNVEKTLLREVVEEEEEHLLGTAHTVTLSPRRGRCWHGNLMEIRCILTFMELERSNMKMISFSEMASTSNSG